MSATGLPACPAQARDSARRKVFRIGTYSVLTLSLFWGLLGVLLFGFVRGVVGLSRAWGVKSRDQGSTSLTDCDWV